MGQAKTRRWALPCSGVCYMPVCPCVGSGQLALTFVCACLLANAVTPGSMARSIAGSANRGRKCASRSPSQNPCRSCTRRWLHRNGGPCRHPLHHAPRPTPQASPTPHAPPAYPPMFSLSSLPHAAKHCMNIAVPLIIMATRSASALSALPAVSQCRVAVCGAGVWLCVPCVGWRVSTQPEPSWRRYLCRSFCL